MPITFCICEDRVAEEYGVRIAVASLRRHSPSSLIVVYRDKATDALVRWADRMGNVSVVRHLPDGASSWNCKPHALLPLLHEGRESVVWIDSDILVARSPDSLLASMGHEELGICEEYSSAEKQGSDVRTRGWGFEVGRSFTRTLNTAVLRVTRAHVPLLERWRALLSEPTYAATQWKPLPERPVHMWGDQDVFNALLGSKEWSSTPVRLLKTGRDIIHCSSATSYSLRERIGGFGRPIAPFIHAQGAKPWVVLDPDRMRLHPEYATRTAILSHEVSPYKALSESYRKTIELPSEWMDYESGAGRVLKALGAGHFAARGLPLTVVATAVKALRRLSQERAS